MPFWLYGAHVDGEVHFDATNETVTEESDRTVTTTDHYDAYRKGNISFKRVPVDGSSKMPDGHMDANLQGARRASYGRKYDLGPARDRRRRI